MIMDQDLPGSRVLCRRGNRILVAKGQGLDGNDSTIRLTGTYGKDLIAAILADQRSELGGNFLCKRTFIYANL